MEYTELLFRGGQIQKERLRVSRERMTAAAFTAWQILSSQVEKLPKLGKYLDMFGLSDDEPKPTDADLKREADQALANVERIKSMHKGK